MGKVTSRALRQLILSAYYLNLSANTTYAVVCEIHLSQVWDIRMRYVSHTLHYGCVLCVLVLGVGGGEGLVGSSVMWSTYGRPDWDTLSPPAFTPPAVLTAKLSHKTQEKGPSCSNFGKLSWVLPLAVVAAEEGRALCWLASRPHVIFRLVLKLDVARLFQQNHPHIAS